MNISITLEHKNFINQKIAAGCYQSSSEIIRAALRLLVQYHELHQQKLDALASGKLVPDQIAINQTMSKEASLTLKRIAQAIRDKEKTQ